MTSLVCKARKTKTEENFDFLLSKIIAPYFKSAGYKKIGNNFKYWNSKEQFGKIVNIQKSCWGTRDDIHFTANIGLYIPDFEFYAYGRRKEEKFSLLDCAVDERVGRIKFSRENAYDLWYDLKTEANVEQVYKEVESDFTEFVLPFLAKIKSRQDVLRMISITKFYDIPAAIKTFYFNRYKPQKYDFDDRIFEPADYDKLIKKLEQFAKEQCLK